MSCGVALAFLFRTKTSWWSTLNLASRKRLYQVNMFFESRCQRSSRKHGTIYSHFVAALRIRLGTCRVIEALRETPGSYPERGFPEDRSFVCMRTGTRWI